jgi:hypothetical protein
MNELEKLLNGSGGGSFNFLHPVGSGGHMAPMFLVAVEVERPVSLQEVYYVIRRWSRYIAMSQSQVLLYIFLYLYFCTFT